MREASASPWMAAGGIIASSAIVGLMLYRGTAYSDDSGSIVLSEPGWLVLVTGVGCLVLSIAMLAYSRHLSAAVPAVPASAEVAGSPTDTPLEGLPAPAHVFDLGGLKEDERRLYDMIADGGGEMLQRDLVASGKFSKAKVTRLLDKLEGRELIKRERHGMTNLVKLVR